MDTGFCLRAVVDVGLWIAVAHFKVNTREAFSEFS